MPRETGGFGVLSLICLLLFIGATGKSAQLPLHVWLPDAMEGPTPVSALIHAATMVTAGVYMVARNAVLFSHAPLLMQIVAIAGALTALMAATIAIVQNDIKRVLAYSTISQLGYMFLATGVGAFAAAIFHLFTHAFFKALLFLGSGSVIHAMAGEQDMRRMGGLRKHMPVTFVAMVLGALAAAGIPPLAGFFSKDEILYQAFLQNRLLWLIGAITALLTAFYMVRLIVLTFYGSYRGPVSHSAHEGPTSMTFPLMALSIGAIVAGFVGIPHALRGGNAIERFLAPSFSAAAVHEAAGAGQSNAGALGLMFFSVAIAVAGILAARNFYLTRPELPARLASRWRGTYSLVSNKFFVDELYDATIIRGTFAAARTLFGFDRVVVDGAVNSSAALTRIASWFSHMSDKYVVDGAVNLLAWTAGRASFLLRRIQTGLLQNYALLMVLGLFAFLTVFLLAR